MKRILQILDMYKQGSKNISQRRQDYYSSAKPIIMETLNEITETCGGEMNCRLYYEHVDCGRNFEYSCLLMGVFPTGIEIIEDTDAKTYRSRGFETGARLFFSLSDVGRVTVWGFGHKNMIGVRNNDEQPERQDFIVVEPSEITKEMVIDCVVKFFEWSLATSIRNPKIGNSVKDKAIGFITDRVRSRLSEQDNVTS